MSERFWINISWFLLRADSIFIASTHMARRRKHQWIWIAFDIFFVLSASAQSLYRCFAIVASRRNFIREHSCGLLALRDCFMSAPIAPASRSRSRSNRLETVSRRLFSERKMENKYGKPTRAEFFFPFSLPRFLNKRNIIEIGRDCCCSSGLNTQITSRRSNAWQPHPECKPGVNAKEIKRIFTHSVDELKH